MRQKLLLTMLLLLSVVAPFAALADSFYLKPADLEVDKTATLQFYLDNTLECYGFQAEITFPDGIVPVKTGDKYDVTLSSDRVSNGKFEVESNILSNGNFIIGAYSANQKPFTGNSGVLADVKVSVAKGFKGGTVKISNILLIDKDDNDVELSSTSADFGVVLTGVSFTRESLALKVGGTTTLVPTFTPTSATDKTLTWKSSDESVATVAPTETGGLVTAVKEGEATITATASNGQTATCVVTVSSNVVEVTSIRLDLTELNLTEGDIKKLVATVSPENATDKTVGWSSSDDSVATVDKDGNVTAIGAGNATITAEAGDKTASCTVTVKARFIEVTGVTLDKTTLSLTEGEISTLKATVAPENASEKSVTWTSSNPEVATVDATGKVTAVAAGTAIITVDASGKTATCEVTVKAKVIAAVGVSLDKTTLSLTEGETSTLKATVAPANATDKSVAWTSSDTAVATVDATGNVTAVAPGTAIITADASGKTATCTVTVKAKTIAVTGVTLDKTTLSLTEGETGTLTATVAPENATDKSVAWTSSNTAVATVDATGKVTAVAAGTATITATASGKTATCTVTVKAKTIAVTGVTLDKTTLSLTEGETGTLTATVAPENATDKSVTWTSSDASIATVKDGVVTAVAPGTATITATASGKTATCTVTVKANIISVTGITISKTELDMTEGDKATLSATIAPDNATDKSVTWTSSDESVATVSDAGEVTAVKAGTATITAASSNGKTVTCTVTVAAKIIAATGVTLNKTTSELKVGETDTLTATVAPEDATDKTIVWTSSDETIASVDATGKVTAKAIGEATITATCGAVKATCKVTVVPTPVESVKLSNSTLAMAEGDKATLIATLAPASATDKTVTWTSSDESVATVSAAGEVTAVKAGTATITATSSNGKTATCTVTVSANIISVTGITISKTELDLTEGDKAILSATVAPDNATDKSVTWTSSDEAVATVSDAGEVTAVKAGTATITAASSNGKTVTCTVTVAAKIIAATSVTLNKTTSELKVGETDTLTVTVAPEDATDKTIVWTSSDETIASVDATGKVTAKAIGEATITATCGAVKATCKVSVIPTPVESVKLSNTALTLVEGDKATLTATVAPASATDKTLTWTSSDESVATVSAAGEVTAVKAGTATITAISSNGKTATCTVTVTAKTIAVSGVTLDKATLSLTEGENATLIATVAPDDATDKTVTWTSSDANIATVDAEGNVTAVAPGTATVTAKAGDKTATCVVTVVAKYIPVEGLAILDEDDNVLNSTHSLALITGDEYTLTEVVSPENATEQKVTWTSSDEAIAKIVDIVEEPHQVHIDAIGAGEATITATLGDFSTSFKVTVTDPVIPVTGITLDKKTAEMLTGATLQLNATIAPADASSKEIKWTSSDNTIASVSTKGLVTAKKAGKVTITATANKFAATCEITITDPIVDVASITLDKNEATLEIGESVKLTATVAPENATDKSVAWTSSNEAVATVDQDGNVTAVAVGEAIIIAKAGDKTAECRVIVEPQFIEVAEITLNITEETIVIGNTLTLVATVTPDDATDAIVTWTSSDELVATVDESGIVTAVGIGNVTITAAAGDKTAECQLTVTKSSGIELLGFDTEAPIKVYNLNGIYVSDKVEGLQAGYYIICQGNEVKKVHIR